MAKALAWEVGGHGIRVNAARSTFIEMAMTAPMLKGAGFRQVVLSKIALGRIGQIDDVMGPIVSLAGAAALVTGSALMVDGGWTAA